jgi:hypothetical protein
MISTRALWTLVRAGDLRARVRANRDGVAAIRLHLAGAAVGTGLLDALADGPATTEELARRMAVPDAALLEAFLRVVAEVRFVAGGDGAPWTLTSRGRAAVDDDLVRAPTRRSRASTPRCTGSSARCSPVVRRGGTSSSRAR